MFRTLGVDWTQGHRNTAKILRHLLSGLYLTFPHVVTQEMKLYLARLGEEILSYYKDCNIANSLTTHRFTDTYWQRTTSSSPQRAHI